MALRMDVGLGQRGVTLEMWVPNFQNKCAPLVSLRSRLSSHRGRRSISVTVEVDDDGSLG